MTARLDAVLAANEDFASALHAGESWAIQHAELVRGVDGKASRQFPERTAREDGKPHNFCGTCIHQIEGDEKGVCGCVSCDLPGSHEVWKHHQMRE